MPARETKLSVIPPAQGMIEERFAIERAYIENLSVGRDLRTLAMTIVAVVGVKGAF